MMREAEEIRCCWELREDRDELVEALGREMARLTAAGVLFRDFAGECPAETMTAAAFTFVDVNRTDFNVKSRRRMMTMFRRINIVPEETARLARASRPRPRRR